MKKVLIAFLLASFYKALLNFTRLKRIQRYEKEFMSFLSNESSK